MSQSNSNNNILSSVSLCMFVKSHGSKARVVPFVNRETGEQFTKLMFPNATFQQGDLAGKTLSASWGKSLEGGLTAQQVAEQKDSLQVIEYMRPENYMVCKQGELRGEDVEVDW